MGDVDEGAVLAPSEAEAVTMTDRPIWRERRMIGRAVFVGTAAYLVHVAFGPAWWVLPTVMVGWFVFGFFTARMDAWRERKDG